MKRRATGKSTIDSPHYVDFHWTVTCDAEKYTMLCPVKLVMERGSTIDIKAMVDCSAEGDFIDRTYTAIMGIKKQALDKPITVRNVDGSLNHAGTITHYVNITLEISERKRKERLLVTKLGKQKIILGLPWLQRENPDIDWQWKTINWRNEPTPKPSHQVTMEEEEEDQWTISTINPTANS